MSDPALRALAEGPLGRAGGVAVFEGAPDPATCTAPAHEAPAACPDSSRWGQRIISALCFRAAAPDPFTAS